MSQWRDTKGDYNESFTSSLGSASSTDKFKLLDVDKFRIVWKPLISPETNIHRKELDKQKESYNHLMQHLLTKYNVRFQKKGEG